MCAVRKLKSGKWQADVVVGRRYDGRPDRRTECCDTKSKAQKAERRFLLEKERMRGRTSGRISFADFLDEVYWPQKTRLRKNTRLGYERDIRLRLLPAFGSMDVDAIDRLAIQRMLMSCPTRKAATNARGTLSSILGVAVEMGMIPNNPAGFHYQYPDASDLPPDNYGVWLPTFADHRRLLEYAARAHRGEPVERMLVLGLCFGLRKGEIFGLDWESVDMEGHRISVVQTYTCAKGGASLNPPKTPRAFRSIPMTAYAETRMLAWGPGSGPVVTGRDGGRMNPRTAMKHIKRMVERERFEDGSPLPRVTLHSLRHSFATACIDAGIEVSRVSAWMGHCDVSTTYNRYVKPTLDGLRGDAELIDAAFEGSAPSSQPTT